MVAPHDPQLLNGGNESVMTEPIAIIGFSLRFPQEATSPQGFWEMLLQGRSAMTEVPKDRFDVNGYYSSDRSKLDILPCRGAHFLKDSISAFDAPFFSMSASEAQSMDPALRGLLETSYRAFENAGIDIQDVHGSNTSVYAGHITSEYEGLFIHDSEIQAKYKVTGNSGAMMSNRLSWFYNLHGPSMTIETACSSSLIALHLACQSLRLKESGMSLVCGSSLYLNPACGVIPLANFGFLSPDSRCFSFDERANGYSKGEGFGVVVLKRLSDALQDGDTIRAVIRATAANQDGRTPSITQPSADAQAGLIRTAYKDFGLDLKSTRYFEAHGTGTSVGDSIEADAIHKVFTEQRSHDDPLYIGAVKSNIGHLEAVSGIAGLIKTVLVLESGIIPPNANFQKVSPVIPAEKWNIKFPQVPTQWPTTGLRRASLNSFGYGGANAHVVLDDALNFLRHRGLLGLHRTHELPDVPYTNGHSSSNGTTQLSLNGRNGVRESGQSEGDRNDHTTNVSNSVNGHTHEPAISSPLPYLLLWSASDEAGIKRLTSVLDEHLSQLSDNTPLEYLHDLAYTLCNKRSMLPWKSYTLASSIESLRTKLSEGVSKPVRSSMVPSVDFVFTGQGAQWATMGLELMVFSTFESSMRDADTYLRGLGAGWSLIEELNKSTESSTIDQPALAQPICTALQVALVDLLASWGIYPQEVVGHSSGEIAAAYCAKAISREAAWSIAYFRGIVTTQLASKKQDGPGAMLAVALSEAELQPYYDEINKVSGTDSIASGCVNSPKNTTVTGSESGIDHLKPLLDAKNVFARKLKVPVAYHSSHMRNIAEDYLKTLDKVISPQSKDTRADSSPRMFSSVTGSSISIEELSKPEYWVRNLVSKVKFSEALHQMSLESDKGVRGLSRPLRYYVEIGPHNALERYVQDTLQDKANYQYGCTLRRGISSLQVMKELAGSVVINGYPVNTAAVNQHSIVTRQPEMLVDLPEYQFNHSQSYWIESRLSKNVRFRSQPRHDILGNPSADWNPLEANWRFTIRVSEHPWIKDHIMNGTQLYPAAGMLAMVVEGARFLSRESPNIRGYRLKDVIIHNALVVPLSDEGVETQLHFRPKTKTVSGAKSQGSWEFRLYTVMREEWKVLCSGDVAVDFFPSSDEVYAGQEQVKLRQYHELHYKRAINECTAPVSSGQFYKSFRDMGAQFGETFMTLQDISYNESSRQAVASTCLDRWRTKLPQIEMQDHIIHPTALDGLFHLPFAVLTAGGTRLLPTMVPTQIGEFWISHDLYNLQQKGSLLLYGKVLNEGTRNVDSSVSGLHPETLEPVISFENYRMTAINSGEQMDSGANSTRRLCCQLDWKPDITFLHNDQVAEYCSKVTVDQPVPTDATSEVVCLYFMTQALEALEKAKYQPSLYHLQKYVEWAKGFLNDFEGPNPLYEDEWKSIFEDNLRREKFFEEYAASMPARNAYFQFGIQLLPILLGEVDALHLLFNYGLAAEIYHGPVFTYSLDRLAAYVDLLAHKNPGMVMLEIGAGTGSGTEPILRSLAQQGRNADATPRYGRYDYTDISPSFFEDAKRRFSKHANRMTFKTLDLEKDPSEQGFQNGEYDVIIAVSVVHAVRDVDEALKAIHKLLKPGGHLLLLEPTNIQSAVIPFFAAVLSGWWRGIEKERYSTPLYSKDLWNKVLKRNNFTGLDICLSDDPNDRNHVFSFLVSTAAHPEPETGQTSPILIVTDDSDAQKQLAANLKSSLESSGLSDCQIVSPYSISYTGSNATCVSLLELESSFLAHMNDEDYKALQNITNISQYLFWVTCNGGGELAARPETGLVAGFGKAVSLERPQLKFTHLDLENIGSATLNITRVLRDLLKTSPRDTETDLVEKDGALYIPRAIEAVDINKTYADRFGQPEPIMMEVGAETKEPLELQFSSGRLDSMRYAKDESADAPLAPGEVEIRVMATGINMKDVMIALGQLPDSHIGHEYAGIVTRTGPETTTRVGERVCGIAGRTFRTHIRSPEFSLMHIPDDVAFVDAGSLPLAAITAHYGLNHLARLQPGESVLIHAAAGGVGQIAVQLAKLKNANIFVTVSTKEKKELLMTLYDIPENHFFSSRTLDFAQQIMRLTDGRGVDVVLNSLAGSALTETWRCIAPLGRFIEIGKRDINSFASLPMMPFSKNVTFASLDVGAVYIHDTRLMGQLTKEVESLIFDTPRAVKTPQPLQVFKRSGFEEALRYLQTGKHSGKAVVDWAIEDTIKVIPSSAPQFQFLEDATYVIAGGLGGIGRSIARWMADRGAKNLILLSRSGTKNAAAKETVDKLKASGIRVVAPRCDIIDANILAVTIDVCQATMPPIRGCIQSSMVVRNATFDRLDRADFQDCLDPKLKGTWNLHNLLPDNMDFFVILSSLAGLHGSSTQCNYAAGSSFQAAFARYRVSQGQHCVSLDLGLVSSIGYIAERLEVARALTLSYMGHDDIEEKDVHFLVELACNIPVKSLQSPWDSQILCALTTPAQVRKSKLLEEHAWMQRPLFRHLYQMDKDPVSTLQEDDTTVHFASLLKEAGSLEDAGAIIATALAKRLSRSLSVPEEDIDLNRPAYTFGVDSLVAIELQFWFSNEMKADVSVIQILSGDTITELGALIAQKSEYFNPGSEDQ